MLPGYLLRAIRVFRLLDVRVGVPVSLFIREVPCHI